MTKTPTEEAVELLCAEHDQAVSFRARTLLVTTKALGAALSELARLQAERDRAVEELAAAAKSMDNARRAIESGQVVDKDVHGTLCRARDRARAALTGEKEGEADGQ